MSICKHGVINFDRKFEAQKEWNSLSTKGKLKSIDRKLCDIVTKRQVILRYCSQRFANEEY